MKYLKRPGIIDAIQYTGDRKSEIECGRFTSGAAQFGLNNHCMYIKTLEGVMVASPGDFIIRGVKGEYYPCKPDVFATTYTAVDGGLDKSI